MLQNMTWCRPWCVYLNKYTALSRAGLISCHNRVLIRICIEPAWWNQEKERKYRSYKTQWKTRCFAIWRFTSGVLNEKRSLRSHMRAIEKLKCGKLKWHWISVTSVPLKLITPCIIRSLDSSTLCSTDHLWEAVRKTVFLGITPKPVDPPPLGTFRNKILKFGQI